MGNYLSNTSQLNETIGGRGTKRSHEDIEIDAIEQAKIEDDLLNTPKRRKLTTTSDYIYETLFKNGENSDVTICALGSEWKLHKVYLCQSGYFSSMFNGRWKESADRVINIDIPDENIDKEALDIAFSSLYRDEIVIKPTMVIQVLAAATLLSLDGLIQQCTSVMIETISAKTVVDYHTASIMYGQTSLTASCLTWLETNIMVWQSLDLLREIDPELIAEVVGSQQLFVMQVEMDVYTMLKKWLYLQFFPSWQGTLKELVQEAELHFRTQAKTNPEFLLTEMGRSYVGPFKALRLPHVINDLPSTKIIEADSIIPKAWLLPIYRRQWLQMLRVEQGHDKGPEKRLRRASERFSSVSLRCGRVLHKDGQYCWRWTGYNFGVDLLVSFTSRLLLIKRNTLSQSYPGATSMQNRRHIIYSMKVCSLNKLGQVVYEKSTGVKHLSFGKDQEQVIMGIDRKAEFPLHISCAFMCYTPKGTNTNATPTPEGQSSANQSTILVAYPADHSSSEESTAEDGVATDNTNHHGNQDIVVNEGEVVHLDIEDGVPYF